MSPKTASLLLLLMLGAMLAPASAQTDYFIYQVTLSLPVTRVLPGSNGTKFETKTLTGNDLVNLALGRALGTRLDPKTEILALHSTYVETNSANAPDSKLIVYDSTKLGAAQIKATIFNFSSAYYLRSYSASGFRNLGFAAGDFEPTALGDSNVGNLFATEVTAGASVTLVTPANRSAALNLSVRSIAGRVKFTYTQAGVTDTFDGLVIKGVFKTAPKILTMYSMF